MGAVTLADFLHLSWLPIFFLISFLAIWFHRRTGTSYGLVNRLYAMVIGGKEFHDNSITEFWNERKDVERFNALFSTKAKSINEVDLLIKWVKEHNVDIRRLKDLKNFFDIENLKVRKIPFFRAIAFSIIGPILLLVAVLILELGIKKAAMIKFHNETQWVWLNHSTAVNVTVPLFHDRHKDWQITSETCSKVPLDTKLLSAKTNLKPESIKNICESFTSQTDRKRVDKIIRNQKIFLLFSLGSFLISIFLIRTTLHIVAARKANAYLEGKVSGTITQDKALDADNNDFKRP